MPKLIKNFIEKSGKKGITNVILMLIVGIVLLIISGYVSSIGRGEEVLGGEEISLSVLNDLQDLNENFANDLSRELESILSLVEGAGEVRVMLTFATSNELIIAQNISDTYSRTMEEDGNDGTRQIENRQNTSSYVIIRQSNGSDMPLIVQEVLPEIAGVIVVAQGGGSAAVREALTRATHTVLGIRPHQVQVFSMSN